MSAIKPFLMDLFFMVTAPPPLPCEKDLELAKKIEGQQVTAAAVTTNKLETGSYERFGTINGMRGYSAVVVAVYHAFYDIPVNAAMGQNAVALFFILSGFVLYLPYCTQSRKMNSFREVGQYMLRRAKRLLPLYWIFLFFRVVFQRLATNEANLANPIGYLKDFFYYGFFFNHWTLTSEFMACQFNCVLWSLGIEWWYSIFFPLFELLWRVVRPLPMIAITFTISFIIRHVGFVQNYPIYTNHVSIGPVTCNIFARMDDFILGMFICHFYFCIKRHGVSILQKLHVNLVLLVLGTFLLYGVADPYYQTVNTVKNFPKNSISFYNNMRHVPLFLIIFSQIAPNVQQNNWWLVKLYKFPTNNPIAQLYGTICYSFYIMTGAWLYHGKWNLFWTGYMPLMTLVSMFLYRFIERGEEKQFRKAFQLLDE